MTDIDISYYEKYRIVSKTRHDNFLKEYKSRCMFWSEYIPISKNKIFKIDISDFTWYDFNKIKYIFGVYLIKTYFGNIYVGCSRSLGDRLKTHINNYNKICDPITNIILFITTDNFHDIYEIEKMLIKRLRPSLNVMSIPKIPLR